MNRLRTIRTVAWGAVFFLVAAVAVVLILRPDLIWRGATGTPVAAIGGPFTLVDQRGAPVTEAALDGHPSALFFGYTYCPDVCPTTLYDMGEWLKQLGPAGDRLKVYFVTVDPERDSQKQLAAYLEAFDPRITGLTGSRAEIDRMLAGYHVYSRRLQRWNGRYLMDHSASVYLFDAKRNFTSTVDYKDEPTVALAKLRKLVGA